MSFPDGFIWGAAAASYQIEGAAYDDGKGPSVWDMQCRRPGAIWSGHTGDVACDHYHRYREDVALMRQVGLHAYRLSISWPRVMPDGRGIVNEQGLAFYDALIDSLLDAGITPYVTLFHWDYPYELYCKGGWLNRDSADWFADYTRVVIDRLSDRVTHWITQNEPQCFVWLGHSTGMHAPGDKLDFPEVLRIAHHTLLAHGMSVQVIRAHSTRPCQIGFAPVGAIAMPATDAPEDVAAARRAMFEVNEKTLFTNSWWSDPAIFGRYPEDGLALFGTAMPDIHEGDMDTICQPLDFYGVNIYSGRCVKAGVDGRPETVEWPVGMAQTAFRWPVTPESLYWGPRFLYERYQLPLIVTENGLSNQDWVALDGKVHDPQRIDFLTRYLREFERAGMDGVDIRGYFQWSIMDNFEWAEGYKERFGLVYVDFATQSRIPKDSAYWYTNVIKTNGASLHDKHG